MYQKIYLDNFKQTLVSRVNRAKRISVYPICKQRLEQTTWIRILLLYRIENTWKKPLVFDEVFDVKNIGYFILRLRNLDSIRPPEFPYRYN